MLSLSGVIKRYGDRTAVDGLTLDVRRGEIFGLLGPNGAGKTTTIGLAVGLLTPDAGSVAIEGASPSDPAVRARLGVAPQSPAIYDELTGRENLRFFGSLYGDADVDRALEFVGLSDRADDRVKTYSGGMKRRLNLAAAIVHDPPLVPPLFVMPPFMQTLSHASPVKWAVLSLEGAIWRGFGPAEMALPCGILLGVGVACFAIGTRWFDWREAA